MNGSIGRAGRLVAAALLAAGCVLPASGAAAQEARGILYRAEGPGGATVYLLGSIHVLSRDAYPLPRRVEDAYADAERVVFETHIDSLQGREVEWVVRGTYRNGQTLRGSVPADVYAQVERAAHALAVLGMAPQGVDRMEPWMAALTFQAAEWQKAGMLAEHGLDMHFARRARDDGKPVGGLESVRFHMELFDAMPLEEQVSFLRVALEDLPRTGPLMREIVGAWRAGSEAALDAIVRESMDRSPALYARLLTSRNAAWVPQIEQMLAGRDDVLVVVGAAHLVGDHGVVAMLRRLGYAVEQR